MIECELSRRPSRGDIFHVQIFTGIMLHLELLRGKLNVTDLSNFPGIKIVLLRIKLLLKLLGKKILNVRGKFGVSAALPPKIQNYRTFYCNNLQVTILYKLLYVKI